MLRKPASENVVCLCHLLNILAKFSNLFLHTGKHTDPDQVHTVRKNNFQNHKQMTKQMTVVVIGSLRVKFFIWWTSRISGKLSSPGTCLV